VWSQSSSAHQAEHCNDRNWRESEYPQIKVEWHKQPVKPRKC